MIGGEFQNMLLCAEQDAAWQPRTTDQIEPDVRGPIVQLMTEGSCGCRVRSSCGPRRSTAGGSPRSRLGPGRGSRTARPRGKPTIRCATDMRTDS